MALQSRRNEIWRLAVAALCGVFIGLSFGICVTTLRLKFVVPSNVMLWSNITYEQNASVEVMPKQALPVGAETLPFKIIVPTTDLYLRRLWGVPDEDLPFKEKYLLVMSVGLNQKAIVNNTISKFSKDWTIMLLHYDGQIDGWNEFEWSQNIIHISALRQTKWWFAKRFLHPDVVEPFDYIFLWDEDLDGTNFDADEYIKLVQKYGLEISQPGIEANWFSWQLTKRRPDIEVHKDVDDPKCKDGPQKPPCAGFVEIMAPVFTRKAWRCMWHLIQNDLVHGWGLDFALQRCASPAHEKIGVVDAQYVIHRRVPSLVEQGNNSLSMLLRKGVPVRSRYEWDVFKQRMQRAEEYEKSS